MVSQPKYQVFISYRSTGGSETALLLYTRLKMDGYVTFFDVETMRSGQFNHQLYERIDECSDVLAVLPPNALDLRDSEEDWVRNELAYALSQGKNVIPVMMRGFKMPETLPEDLKALRYGPGVTADVENFDSVYEKIKKRMRAKPHAVSVETSDRHLRHGAVLLKNGQFEDALQQYEEALTHDLTCGEAYLGRLMAHHRVCTREDFRSYFQNHIIYNSLDYKLAVEYADAELKPYLDSLELPKCRNHGILAAHNCDCCGDVLCTDCVREVKSYPWDHSRLPWPSEKLLCDSCMGVLHEHSMDMWRSNRWRIWLFIIGLLAGVAANVLAVYFSDVGRGVIFLALGLEVFVGKKLIQLWETDPEEADEEDADFGLLFVFIQIILYICLAPFMILYSIAKRVYLLVKMRRLIRQAGLAAEKGMAEEQYVDTYYEFVRITRVLHATEPELRVPNG